MLFMVIVKVERDSQAGILPNQRLVAAMAKYHEELQKAGVLLDVSGFRP